MPAKIRRAESLKRLLTTEIKDVIEQSNLGYPDEYIATAYFVNRETQSEIAEAFNFCDHSAVSRRIDNIIDRMDYTAKKLKYI